MSRLIRAVIDTHALRHNLSIIRARAGSARVLAVVKANAYGHGLVPTALALGEADAFAVARLEEGLALRAAGITAPIVLLEGVFSATQLQEAAHHGLELVVHDALQIELLEQMRGTHRFVLWIKIDTGMNRLGFPAAEFAAALERVRRLTPAPLEIRLLTHLACANERDEAVTQAQLARLLHAVDVRPINPEGGRAAGILLGAAQTSDPIDATVVLLAAPGDRILTSDPTDLTRLARAASSRAVIVPC